MKKLFNLAILIAGAMIVSATFAGPDRANSASSTSAGFAAGEPVPAPSSTCCYVYWNGVWYCFPCA